MLHVCGSKHEDENNTSSIRDNGVVDSRAVGDDDGCGGGGCGGGCVGGDSGGGGGGGGGDNRDNYTELNKETVVSNLPDSGDDTYEV